MQLFKRWFGSRIQALFRRGRKSFRRSDEPLIVAVRRHRLFEHGRILMSFVMGRMRETQLPEVASSMTLTTLLSLVPLLAVSLAVFAAFPSFADMRTALENMIFNSLLPPQYSENIVDNLRNFSTHASGLGAFGLIGLAMTALLMIDKFVVTLNRLFKVTRPRPMGQRALIYWAILTLAPMIIAISFTLSGFALRIAFGADPGAVPGWALELLQILLQLLGYTLLFKVVPNCPVRFVHALVGGTFVALAGSIVREGFSYYVTAGTLSSIYGAFVALPVFLLWIYVVWLLVFAGAAMTASIPLLRSGRFADSYRVGESFVTAVALLRELTRAKLQGRNAIRTHQLVALVDSHPQAVDRILSELAKVGICGEIRYAGGRTKAWALLVDPYTTNLRKVVDQLLIDPKLTLISPKRVSLKRNEGPLNDWYRTLISSPAFDAPLVSLCQTRDKADGA